MSAARIGERVWCYGAQSYRPFGTAAEYTTVPTAQAVPLPASVSFEQGACLGIPAITAHRCVHVAGPVEGRIVLIQGGAGVVGVCAVQFARRAGATVIAAVRSGADDASARHAGAHHVVHIGPDLVQQVHALAPQGVTHIVDVAFGANIAADVDMLDVRGSIATYATNVDTPAIPFWLLLFKNIRIDFLGSDDFAPADKEKAARATNEALLSGWRGMPIVEQFPLDEIASAHEVVEASRPRVRVVVML